MPPDSESTLQTEAAPSAGAVTRALVVAMETAASAEVISEVLERLGQKAELLVMSPALAGSALKHAMGDVDEAVEEAQERTARSGRELDREGVEVQRRVGDSDPIIAIEDALAEFPADKIFLITRPDEEARWLEGDVFERAKQRFEQEIIHIAVEGADAQADVAGVERSGPGIEPPPDEERDPESPNLPKYSVRDLAGIAIAVVGTIVLVVLAGQCEGNEVQRAAGVEGAGSDGSCVARYVIAGAAALVNMAHVVALMLFQSVGYRGGWARFFALLSLVGTPLAVVASLLVH